LYEFVLYNSYKKCMNWYKNHTVYEFVLYNLYNNCIQKLAKKDGNGGAATAEAAVSAATTLERQRWWR
jgi:hypothetical protein